jgi:hypothetical protein
MAADYSTGPYHCNFRRPESSKAGIFTNHAGASGRLRGLEQYVKQNESLHQLKPDNEARIVWANDSIPQLTNYSIVYLHGFSASQKEGDPVHRNIAKEFGCNLYLSRLAEHGIDTSEQLLNLTADNLLGVSETGAGY